MLKPLLPLLALIPAASAVEIRVATFNIGAHFTSEGFPDYSLGDPGTPDHDKVRDILGRIDADVVALQEIASADVSGSPDDLDALAASLGYPHLYVAPVNDASPLKGPFDTSLRVAFLSRFPFLSTAAVRSPEGAREITRLHPVVRVDVPGTARDPLLISAHLKSGTAAADKFRRTVDMKRLVGHLNGLGLTESDNYIILGDFNLSSTNASYSVLPADLPGEYDLGSDLPLPVNYSTNPLSYFSSPAVTRLDPRQLNGSAGTFQSGSVIDLFLVSPAIAGRPFDTEIYNSTLDVSNGSGLPKAGQPLAAGTSAAASDHYALFADFELDSELPDLDLNLSASSVREGLPDGTVLATVRLPATRPGAVTVTLSTDDPAAAPVVPELVIPAGSLSASGAIRAPRNFVAGLPRAVTFTATASGYDPDSAGLLVTDADGPYTFTAAGQTVSEGFSGFAGDHDPAPWVTTGGATWLGVDDGSSVAPGWRAYGPAADPSLGFLPQGAGATATANFVNQSAMPLTALRIAFDVEQWRAALGGTADTLSADLIVNGQPIPLPALSHAASRSLPSGAVTGGLATPKATVISGLSIPPGASFGLRVTFTPGPGGGAAPAEVFVNEFHYDNAGTDTGEFIEVAVAPGFAGQPADLDVVLYNGATPAAATSYGVLNLASFEAGDPVNGYRLYSMPLGADGIQNGSNDGFAIVNKVTGQVLQLISYEGTFTAAAGTPAAGMTSVSIGISQNNSTTLAGSSLGLGGAGAGAGDFTWVASSGANTRGAVNAGQSFVVPALPPQGLAVDNLSVTALADADSDGDGLADSLDADDDNDGQSDADERAFGTDPVERSSIFKPLLTRAAAPPHGFTLTFPGAAGIGYVVETSTDLDDWSELSAHAGSGQPVIVPLPAAGPVRFFRVRAGG